MSDLPVQQEIPLVDGSDQAGPAVSYLDLLESEPTFASEMFGHRIEVARQYTDDLARRGEELGLIGPLELPRLWTRHIINCGLVAPLLRAGRVGDVGSGAGLPGLVLAIARPDCHLVLIEPMERRVAWLESEARDLGLDNVTVIRARAEEARLDAPLDQVTARAVTALTKLIPATVGLVRHGGEMVFMKGARVSDEMVAAKNIIRKHHLVNAEVLVLGEGQTPELTRVFRATVD
ncbi:16S rRNA (guanine527-N7)-methyltransferase [Salinibacterium sp. CAN_S4]